MFKVTMNTSTYTRNLQKVAREFPDRVTRAMKQEAEIEVTEMKRRTPVDTTLDAPHPGRLRNSIHVEEVETQGKVSKVTIATGKEAPYAIYVHENPDAIHPVGQWKFMESVIKESAPHMKARLAKRLHFDRGDE